MRKFGFYAKLAAQNMKKNGKYYLPYLLTCIGAAAMFYILFFLSENEGIGTLRGGTYVMVTLWLGAGVIGIFSTILIFYTNSSLMKRRKKELGLYNILGMEKRQIAHFLFWETVYTAVIGIACGIGVGILLSKLMLLLLCAILKAGVPFGFFVSNQGILWTVIVFCLIFALCLLYNWYGIKRAKPIELLRSGRDADREPRTHWLAALIGSVTLAAGYGIALSVKSPVSALGLFFVAVILVIIGTYCLFSAGSIAVLKLLRSNRAYYYQTEHFTTVSGMLHRMKRNAAGLSSICILSTMVLVTVSSTVCLYAGTEEALDNWCPRDVQIILREADEDAVNTVVEAMQDEAKKQGMEISDLAYVRYYVADADTDPAHVCGEALKEGSHGELVWATGEEDTLPDAYVGFNVTSGEVPPEFYDGIWDVIGQDSVHFKSANEAARSECSDELYGMYGGFFFIGLLLGFLFLMATALIIYYKQVSEGYEDAEGFKIMQQVGMSESEVKSSVHSQILTVFFLPILAAAVHISFAFPMITKLFKLFYMTNIALFAWCTLGALLVFAAIYAMIYALTAKVYYQIVKV
ncbi:MAG TPA: ABC transporter permease [Oscillospiraceae bacterium]|nr:ABC transporter permease [Oscillospiraceae bacterium]HRW57174.1 ABC transporter permease [Oscillospiraceae bacterium]